jgi:hypothetical protein
MLTSFWSSFGFSVAGILPKERHFDSHYLHSTVLHAIFGNRLVGAVEDRMQNMMLPFDNTTPHKPRVTTDYLICNWVAQATRRRQIRRGFETWNGLTCGGVANQGTIEVGGEFRSGRRPLMMRSGLKGSLTPILPMQFSGFLRKTPTHPPGKAARPCTPGKSSSFEL